MQSFTRNVRFVRKFGNSVQWFLLDKLTLSAIFFDLVCILIRAVSAYSKVFEFFIIIFFLFLFC